MSLSRPDRLLGQMLGLVGRVALKFGVTRRIVVTLIGVAAAVILILGLLAIALLGG